MHAVVDVPRLMNSGASPIARAVLLEQHLLLVRASSGGTGRLGCLK
jgi:hypothetical protein